VDTTQLRYFVAVVDCQSFSKAANHCHTSQPNLSEQVRNLEGFLGTTLLDRSGRQIGPTETGKLLWERAKVILSQIDETKQVLHSIAAPGKERVTIGVMTTVASCFLAYVLNSFIELHPKIQLDIQENITPELLPMIERGSLDLGINHLPRREATSNVPRRWYKAVPHARTPSPVALCQPNKHQKCPLPAHAKDRKKTVSKTLRYARFHRLVHHSCSYFFSFFSFSTRSDRWAR